MWDSASRIYLLLTPVCYACKMATQILLPFCGLPSCLGYGTPVTLAAVNGTALLSMHCKNVWVWKVARFVMLVWHDSQLCVASPQRAPSACYAKTQFLLRSTQLRTTEKLVMLGSALQCAYYSLSCFTSFQTQTYLHFILRYSSDINLCRESCVVYFCYSDFCIRNCCMGMPISCSTDSITNQLTGLLA